MKSRTKRKITWYILSALAAIVMLVMIVPPAINLNSMRPRIQAAILNQTGIDAKINGNVHISMLGRITIVAHDIEIENGKIDSAMFALPLTALFNLNDAAIDSRVTISGGHIKIDELTPVMPGHDISVRDTSVEFMDKEYKIVSGDVSNGRFIGTVRTADHKYDVDFIGDTFIIKNNANNLQINGRLYSDGSARGKLSIDTGDINSWFEFNTPKITQNVRMTMNFDWDGEYGFKFTDIRANNFTGTIILSPDGARDITLRSDNADVDLSFLLKPNPELFSNTKLNIDLRGNIIFASRKFKHIVIQANSSDNRINITRVVADDMSFTGGYIDHDGAHDIKIVAPIDSHTATCLFSGTPNEWQCASFTYDDMHGIISVEKDTFDLFVESDKNVPSKDIAEKMLGKLGKRGTVRFNFADGIGTWEFPNGKIQYVSTRNKTLANVAPQLWFLPEFMRNTRGSAAWDSNDRMVFIPENKNHTWRVALRGDAFEILGDNIRDLMPGIDLSFIQNMPYTASGNVSHNTISNLVLSFAEHVFHGTVSSGTITLTTDLLNLDAITDQSFIDNYSELEFLKNAPLMTLFNLPIKISLSADTMIYNGDEYKNFVYTLKPDVQTFSITDDARGNALVTIRRDRTRYDISVRLGKFRMAGNVLGEQMPINLHDTVVTALIEMQTHGRIAHDIWYNLGGTIDATFDGGYISGIGVDKFYASADSIQTLNAEYALANALESGTSVLKKMHIAGNFSNGNFETTTPMSIAMRHVDGTGIIEITDDKMYATLNLTLRGTSPAPTPITLHIAPNGARNYSLSEIMRNFDPGFLREFVKTHNRF